MILYLTLKKKWFDQIEAGFKLEEYREIKDYWIKRLTFKNGNYKPYKYIWFKHGYNKNSPKIFIELKKIRIGKPKSIWIDDSIDKDVFILELGNIIGTKKNGC